MLGVRVEKGWCNGPQLRACLPASLFLWHEDITFVLGRVFHKSDSAALSHARILRGGRRDPLWFYTPPSETWKKPKGRRAVQTLCAAGVVGLWRGARKKPGAQRAAPRGRGGAEDDTRYLCNNVLKLLIQSKVFIIRYPHLGAILLPNNKTF